MKFKTGSWNLKGNFTSKQIELIENENFNLICFQEFTSNNYSKLLNSYLFDWSVFSISLRHSKRNEKRARQLGCLIAGREPFLVNKFNLLNEAPFPERTLIAEISSPLGNIHLCSFHAPPGVSWGEDKPETFRLIANWLSNKNERTIFGMDANCPKNDHLNLELTEWWWDDESILLGVNKIHPLEDTLRTYIEQNNNELNKIKTLRPTGPLAVSFDRGKTKNVYCRYDYIFATKDFEVIKVEYKYKEAIEAGSDHALVIAELELNEKLVPTYNSV